jgi:hypothetical protein
MSPTSATRRFCGSSMQDGRTARFVASKLSSYDRPLEIHCPLALGLRNTYMLALSNLSICKELH